jgi:TonB family protein
VFGGAMAVAQEPAPEPKEVIIHAPPGGRITLGGAVTAAKITNKVGPVYPPLARQTRISGTVRLHVIIGKEGSVLQLEVLSGHPLLVQSALDAVRQWKYQPTLLDGEPMEVDTTIDVIYALNENTPKGTQQDAPKRMGLVPNAIDPAFRADILQLLDQKDASKSTEAAMRKMFDGMRPMMLKSFAGVENREKILDSYEDKLVDLAKMEDYREGLVAAYAKYFNDEDAKALITFYGTPTGKKFNQVLPQFSAELIGLGQRIAEVKLPDIFQELCKEYPELQGKFPGCPATDPDKKSQLAAPVNEPRASGK